MSDAPLQFPAHDDEPRPCGDCHACCIALQIDELAKPRHTRCPQLTDYRGCGVYADRSQTCRNFSCLWSLGVLGVGNRPDKLGVLLQAFRLSDGTPIIGATELWTDAFSEPLAIWALAMVQPVTDLILRVCFDGRTAYAGTPEAVGHAVELERAHA